MNYETDYQGPWLDLVEKNRLVVNVGEWRYQRPVTKEDKCCGCGTCSILCPTGCIEKTDDYFSANLNFCKGCGLCAQVCPVAAIKMVLEGNK